MTQFEIVNGMYAYSNKKKEVEDDKERRKRSLAKWRRVERKSAG